MICESQYEVTKGCINTIEKNSCLLRCSRGVFFNSCGVMRFAVIQMLTSRASIELIASEMLFRHPIFLHL